MNWDVSKEFEKACNKNFAPKFFKERLVWTPTEINQTGIDTYIKGYKVDMKYCLPIESLYNRNKKDRDFFIEKEQKRGDSWLDHDGDILICYFWFYDDKKEVRQTFYRLSDLKALRDDIINRPGYYWGTYGVRLISADTETTGWYVTESMLRKLELSIPGVESRTVSYEKCMDNWYWNRTTDIWGNEKITFNNF